MFNRKLPRNVIVLAPIDYILSGTEGYQRRKAIEAATIEHLRSKPMTRSEAESARNTLLQQLDALDENDTHRSVILEALSWVTLESDETQYFVKWLERKAKLLEMVAKAIDEDEARRQVMVEALVNQELSDPANLVPVNEWLRAMYADMFDIDDEELKEVKFFIKYNSNSWMFPLGLRFPVQIPSVTGINDSGNEIPAYKETVASLNAHFRNAWVKHFGKPEVWRRLKLQNKVD